MYHIIHVRILFWILEFLFGHLIKIQVSKYEQIFIFAKALVKDFDSSLKNSAKWDEGGL